MSEEDDAVQSSLFPDANPREKNPHAAAMAALGAAKGGRARASKLSPEERKEIARKGALARWSSKDQEAVTSGGEEVLIATHIGELELGTTTIDCAVLNDGRRVLSQRSVGRALGRRSGGKDWKGDDRAGKLPYFLVAENIKPFISSELMEAGGRPILYRQPHGGTLAHGIDATLLPQICEVWLRAREADALRKQQEKIAIQAEILMRGLARIGIIALVDEATGYQYERDKGELHKILSAYISEELMPWTQRFPDSFYEELFRLQGWQYSPPCLKRPKMAGKLTAELIYEKLPPGVLERLREKNPIVRPGYRRHKHHQFLTEDIGDKHLEKQVVSVTTLMRVSPDWKTFKTLFNRAFPSRQKSIEELLPVPEEDD